MVKPVVHKECDGTLQEPGPELLALCPLHITLYRQEELTHVVFTRPTHVGKGSAAPALLAELEAKVSTAVEAGIRAAQQ